MFSSPTTLMGGCIDFEKYKLTLAASENNTFLKDTVRGIFIKPPSSIIENEY